MVSDARVVRCAGGRFGEPPLPLIALAGVRDHTRGADAAAPRPYQQSRPPHLCLFFSGGLRNRLLVGKTDSRLQVQKTYKLFIGGKFVRGENGRVILARGKNDQVLANYPYWILDTVEMKTAWHPIGL